MVGDEGICKVAEGRCFVVPGGFTGLFFDAFFLFGEVFDGIYLFICEEFEYFLIGFVEMFEDVFFSGGGMIKVIFGEKFKKAFVYFFDKL